MGYILRSELPSKYFGGGDDTALNDIILYCNHFDVDPRLSPTEIKSSGANWGDWIYPGYCPSSSPATGFAMQMEFPHSGDDTAANDIRLLCSNFKMAFSPVHTHWGYWLSQVTCPENTVVTGLMTRVEAKTGDDTALNGLRLQCSQAPNL